jgi:hypothetical protein
VSYFNYNCSKFINLDILHYANIELMGEKLESSDEEENVATSRDIVFSAQPCETFHNRR